jgi:hypothetical protein
MPGGVPVTVTAPCSTTPKGRAYMAEVAVRVPFDVHQTEWLRALPGEARFVFRGDAETTLAAGAAFGAPLAVVTGRAVTHGDRAALSLGPDEHLVILPEQDAAAFAARLASERGAGRIRWWTSVTARSRSSCAVRMPNGCSHRVPAAARVEAFRSTRARVPCCKGRDRAVLLDPTPFASGSTLLLSLRRRPARRSRARAASEGIPGCRRRFLICRTPGRGVSTVEVTDEPIEDTR